MNILTKREWATLTLIIVFSSLPTIGGLVRLIELGGGPSIIPVNPRAIAAPLPIIIHVLSSFVFCNIGILQFLPSLKKKYPTQHRQIGYLVITAGAVSAISGLWMTIVFHFPEELQGSLLFSVRITISIAMLSLIACAIFAIKSKAYNKHSSSMLRAYAIAQGASTQATFGILWIVITGEEPTGVLRDVFMTLCWAINLIVAQVLIRFSILSSQQKPHQNNIRSTHALSSYQTR